MDIIDSEFNIFRISTEITLTHKNATSLWIYSIIKKCREIRFQEKSWRRTVKKFLQRVPVLVPSRGHTFGLKKIIFAAKIVPEFEAAQ